ncbi:MAG: Asp-tRNA(Asn)/Glu-tRNA(Gln) amidotransferase subunit GatA [Gemmatimonadaceae bacterium]
MSTTTQAVLADSLLDQGVARIVEAVHQDATMAMAVVSAAQSRIATREADALGLNAVVATDWMQTQRATADRIAEHQQGAGTLRGALAGVPVLIKDNIATLGLPTTCASRILAGYVSPFEATAVRRLVEAGAVVLGKTNMDEFAMGSSTEHSAFGPTCNPHDRTRVPGGSSGGSAAAVAAGVTPVALGSETGGSVRQPAAFCGVVGVKPTYGRVSRYGLVAYASSLDHIGVFGRSVNDAARVLEVISGGDPRDATAATQPVPPLQHTVTGSLAGVVIGKPIEYFPDTLDPQIRARSEAALARMAALGAEIREVSLPHTALAIPVYYIVAPAEASSNLARFDGVRFGQRQPGAGLREMYEATRSTGFGAEVQRRILLGTYVLSAGYYDAYYRRAQAVRQRITEDFAAVFRSGVHLLFTPTTPTTAFPIGAVTDPYEMYLSDIFTVTANLAGIPAMSLPIGRVDGLPVGGQLLAAHFDEATMLRVAAELEAAFGAEAHQ